MHPRKCRGRLLDGPLFCCVALPPSIELAEKTQTHVNAPVPDKAVLHFES